MQVNLLQNLFGQLTNARTEALGTLLGVDKESAEKAIGSGLSAMLGALISRASGEPGASGLLKSLRETAPDNDLLDRLLKPGGLGASADPSVSGLLGAVFGDRQAGAAEAISSFSGISRDSAAKILGMAAPLLMAAVSRSEPKEGFTAASLMHFLADQKPHLAHLAPPGIAAFIGALPGMSGFAEMATAAQGGRIKRTTYVSRETETRTTSASPSTTAAAATSAAPQSGGESTPWLVLVALAIPMTFLGARACQAERATVIPAAVAPATTAAAAATAPTTAAAPLPYGVERIEVGGRTLDIARNSIGWELYQYLRGAEPAGSAFIFDNLNFESGSDRLTAESAATVTAVAAVLSAYPRVEATIVGHTDDQGPASANLDLSGRRAKTVATKLVVEGVTAGRLKTEGRGEAEPIIDNRAPDGRLKNRRVELMVTKK